ncbi:MAG TPA: maleylpyruvate isomerase family mycothiol-dependent enzyme [Amycolatopsis sp.]|uniref:maleylpyruvate isomerase family mycothiol-dependent enzyme n=1 Tax=Amycolatopsis sp. TaxID=37632 RepID=UPI002B45F2DE|nr:maleylpyruvate isomerase family mycothiol-dependent enzyme [Amycolatopsis sp.]HKS44512.1 maleylpyruvate isomerase family mycothiol-dependent enzyme [Amycolatopsis sp.]
MTGVHDTAITLPWMREGTTRLLDLVTTLDDTGLRAASGLPGWSRAHVVGHLARNAEALTRLATWARTGIENPMYADPGQRADEIEQSASLPAAELRRQLRATADVLDTALSSLTTAQWSAPVRSALGRRIPAAEIPWMRIREVWLHAADLTATPSLASMPDGALDLLLDDTTTTLSRKPDCPAVVVAPGDRDRTWRLQPDIPAADTITAPAAEIAGWLTGRLPGRPGWPPLPRWL